MTKQTSPLAAVSPTQQSSRLPIEWLGELEPSAEPRWLVEGLVPAGGLIAMIGPPSAGKTFLAIDLALHVASGRDWLGRQTESGLVIYLGAEDPSGLRMRLIAARDHLGLDQTTPLALLNSDLNLLRAGDVQTLIEWVAQASAIAQLPASLFIVDTLSRTFGDGDENGADMANYVRQLAMLQTRFDCAVMVLHHPPKSPLGRTPRGHSSLPAACDTLLAVGGRKPRRLIVEKQRNGPAGMIICFELRPVDATLLPTCVVEQTEAGALLDDGRRFGDDERAILAALTRLQEEEGTAPPPDLQADVRAMIRSDLVVSLRRWEDVARGLLPTAGRRPDSIRKAFQRARDRLVGRGTIGMAEDLVWLIE